VHDGRREEPERGDEIWQNDNWEEGKWKSLISQRRADIRSGVAEDAEREEVGAKCGLSITMNE